MKGWRSPRTQHGTLSMYRYCKCDECRAAMSRYLKKWKRKRRGRQFDIAMTQIFKEAR